MAVYSASEVCVPYCDPLDPRWLLLWLSGLLVSVRMVVIEFELLLASVGNHRHVSAAHFCRTGCHVSASLRSPLTPFVKGVFYALLNLLTCKFTRS